MFKKPRQGTATRSSGTRFGGRPGSARPGEKKRDFRGGPEGRGGGRFFQKKTCRFCAEKSLLIDYKDVERLRRFMTEKGKIMPRRITGNCSGCQRELARALKRARHAGLVAFQID